MIGDLVLWAACGIPCWIRAYNAPLLGAPLRNCMVLGTGLVGLLALCPLGSHTLIFTCFTCLDGGSLVKLLPLKYPPIVPASYLQRSLFEPGQEVDHDPGLEMFTRPGGDVPGGHTLIPCPPPSPYLLLSFLLCQISVVKLHISTAMSDHPITWNLAALFLVPCKQPYHIA